jgi:diguanylate cyclase (GGDEF)-like protein
VYDTGRKIRYSTDTLVLGQIDGGNARLDRVLRLGEVDSHVESKDKMADLYGEERLGVDVVETYVPIRVGDAVIGSFEVYIDITPTDRSLERAAGMSLAVLVVVLLVVFGILFLPMRQGTRRLSRMQDQLREMAAIDVLTGLFNRRHLFARIGSEFARAERAVRRHEPKEDIGFILVDIDHFKAINDTHGHQAGDEVLKQFSTRLKSLIRAYDVIGRYGGEEFLVMLPNTNAAEATVVAERMRRVLAETPIIIGSATILVTASLGVASAPESGADAETAIHRADECLYRAKAAGRNRVVTAS